MSDNNNSQWSSKFKKFGITNPFLKLITVKYENSIPWQSVVKDEKTLQEYVKDVLLFNLEKKTLWNNYSRSAKNLFIHFEDLDIDQILETDELNQDEKKYVNEQIDFGEEYYHIEDEPCISPQEVRNRFRKHVAIRIGIVINNKKAASFKVWFDNVKKKYPKNVAFQYLILKPIIDQSGYNSRRLLTAPDNGVLKWLSARIQHEFYLPSTNFGFEYRMRLSCGLNSRIMNGWQFIPSGTENTSKLTAASARSGWCIAGNQDAKSYLENCNFYIFREKGKPVVAIRIENKNQLFWEIRGIHNEIPYNYYSEIWFFICSMFPNYRNISLFVELAIIKSMIPDFSKIVSHNMDSNKNNLEWWQEMTDKWPGTFDLVPDHFKLKIKFENSTFITNQFYLSLGMEFRQKYGINFSESDYVSTLEHNPHLYPGLGIDDNPKLDAACIKGVLNRLILNDITHKEYKDLPEFVHKNAEIVSQINSNLPLSFEKNIIKRGSNYSERNEAEQFEDYLPFMAEESMDLTVLRALESILKNKSSDFTDVIFSENVISHPEFYEIRKQAWLKAVIKNPTFYFAFPIDLIQDEIWSPQIKINIKYEKTLASWISRIKYRPWYLETEGKVPKSVRYHEALLRAYLKGWGEILSKTPYQIWKKVNTYQRAYMSYAALRNFSIFSILANSFGSRGGGFSKASERMRQIPAYQLAFLYSRIIHKATSIDSKNLINSIRLPTQKKIIMDPQYELIQLFLTKQFKLFTYQVNKKDTPENYYFNKIDPDVPMVQMTQKVPMVQKIKIGSLVELEIEGEIRRISIGINTEGFEFVEKGSPEVKLLLNKKEGDLIQEFGIQIKKIL